MSVERIIQETINKNPLEMKEALEEELKERIRLALEASEEEDFDQLQELSNLYESRGIEKIASNLEKRIKKLVHRSGIHLDTNAFRDRIQIEFEFDSGDTVFEFDVKGKKITKITVFDPETEDYGGELKVNLNMNSDQDLDRAAQEATLMM